MVHVSPDTNGSNKSSPRTGAPANSAADVTTQNGVDSLVDRYRKLRMTMTSRDEHGTEHVTSPTHLVGVAGVSPNKGSSFASVASLTGSSGRIAASDASTRSRIALDFPADFDVSSPRLSPSHRNQSRLSGESKLPYILSTYTVAALANAPALLNAQGCLLM